MHMVSVKLVLVVLAIDRNFMCARRLQRTQALMEQNDVIAEGMNNTEEMDMQWLPIPDQARTIELFHLATPESLAQNFLQVANAFEAQDMPTYCGVASAVIAMNSLLIRNPQQQALMPKKYEWMKLGFIAGDFRAFSQTNLWDTSLPSVRKAKANVKGVTIDELATLMRGWGKSMGFSVEKRTHLCWLTPSKEQLDQFILDVKRACSDKTKRMVINYDRAVVGEKGSGHWSPIAAWAPSHVVEETEKGSGLEEKIDMGYVLVMDVSIYKYPWMWFKVEDIFRAIFTCDRAENPRGYLLLESHELTRRWSATSMPNSPLGELTPLSPLHDSDAFRDARSMPNSPLGGLSPRSPLHDSDPFFSPRDQ